MHEKYKQYERQGGYCSICAPGLHPTLHLHTAHTPCGSGKSLQGEPTQVRSKNGTIQEDSGKQTAVHTQSIRLKTDS